MVNKVMAYNIASYSGIITGAVGGDLVIAGGGAIQTATGDIQIGVGGDLYLETGDGSAIRTTGTAAINSYDYAASDYDWLYQNTHDGGNITMAIGGSLFMDELPFYYDSQNNLTAHLDYWSTIYYDSIEEADYYYYSADYGWKFTTRFDAHRRRGHHGRGERDDHRRGRCVRPDWYL